MTKQPQMIGREGSAIPEQDAIEAIAMKRWNEAADQFNQWSELGEDEKR